MKKLSLTLFMCWICLFSFTQDLSVNFIGRGDTTAIDSVKALNHRNLQYVVFSGSDTLTLVDEINSVSYVEINSKSELYPNPSEDGNFKLKFEVYIKENVNFNIFKITGELIYNKTLLVYNGLNTIVINGIPNGMYICQLRGNNLNVSNKLLSINNNISFINVKVSEVSPNDIQPKYKNNAINKPILLYTPGDEIEYIGITYKQGTNVAKFGTIIVNKPTDNNKIIFDFIKCLDSWGNYYKTVRIPTEYRGDSLVWMAEDYNGGEYVFANEESDNNILEKYCLNNDIDSCQIYGGLYTFNEINNYDTTGNSGCGCPEGWRLPTENEWDNIIDYYGDSIIAGGAMKTVGLRYWRNLGDSCGAIDTIYYNVGATNTSGFSIKGGASYTKDNGFSNIYTDHGYWCSEYVYNPEYALARFKTFQACTPSISSYYADINNESYSIRCVKSLSKK